MAIYLSGDIHGTTNIDKLVEYFDENSLTEPCSKEDSYLIILGDCGVLWDDGEGDKSVKDILDSLPVTVLWLDGNHENFDLINSYPVEMWHGGKVHRIHESIIHLMRGQIFEIDGLRFFVFGGGNSIDKYLRYERVNWWPEEMPSGREYEEGLVNLEAAGNKVDYILTHTCPREIAYEMSYYLKEGEEELQQYLQRIADWNTFDEWYFGHWHRDEDIEQYHCLYDEIVQLV